MTLSTSKRLLKTLNIFLRNILIVIGTLTIFIFSIYIDASAQDSTAQTEENKETNNELEKVNGAESTASTETAKTKDEENTSEAEDSNNDSADEDVTTTTDAKSSDSKYKNVEKLQVTGSLLKRINSEGTSPVVTFDKEQLDKSGYNSVADVLRDSAINSFGSTRENSGGNAAGVAHINLRGLGATRTLVLLNGKRLPTDPVSGAVDLNMIPMAAVERIDILKDSASATYGSDAIGGVVNIITKKEFNGVEISIKGTSPKEVGGDKVDISLVSGSSSAQSRLITSVNYLQNKMIYSRDRDWSNEGISTLGSPGSYRQINADNTKGNWTADPNCPADRLQVNPNGSFCTFPYAQYSTTLPALEQFGIMSEYTYEVNESVEFFGRVNGIRNRAEWIYAPSPGIFKVQGSVADTLGPGGGPLTGITPGSDVEIRYRLTELGNRVSNIETNSFGVLGGFRGPLTATWDWEITSMTQNVRRIDFGVSGYAISSKLNDLISNGDFNPFAQEGQRGSLDSAIYKPWQDSKSQIDSTDLLLTGELFNLSGGALAMAVGVSNTKETYKDTFDPVSVQGDTFGNAGSSGAGSRETDSAFTEFAIPFTSNFEISLSARYDSFSDFGETTNPKFGLRWQMTPSFLIRGSAGTGFKAPSMQDLYASASEGYPTFIDHVSCEKEKADGGDTPACEPQQYLVKSGGNPHLKEEESQSAGIGFVYQPSKSFSFGIDAWTVELSNVVGVKLEDVTKAEQAGIDVSQYGVSITRDSDGYIEEIYSPLLNLSKREILGFDTNLELNQKTSIGTFSQALDFSLITHYKEEGFPGTGYRDILGESGTPPWRSNLKLGWASELHHEVSFAINTTAKTEKAVKENGYLKEFTQVNFQYSYAADFGGTLTFGAMNIFNSKPPLDDTEPRLDTSIHDPRGPLAYIAYKQTL